MNTGKAIKKALVDAGQTQTWLAGKLGVTKQSFGVICNRKSCNTETLERISIILEISVSDLIAQGE